MIAWILGLKSPLKKMLTKSLVLEKSLPEIIAEECQRKILGQAYLSFEVRNILKDLQRMFMSSSPSGSSSNLTSKILHLLFYRSEGLNLFETKVYFAVLGMST